MDVAATMTKLALASPWTCGDTVASIRMLDGSAPPTQAQLDAAWAAVQADRQAAATAEATAQTERQQVRTLILAFGTGTAGERLTRLETVVKRIARDLYR